VQPPIPPILVPYARTIYETSGRGERMYDIYSLLLKERIIFLGSAIDNDLANYVVALLLYLAAEDPEREIRLYINSPGGIIYSGLAIYDAIQQVSAPVSTYAIGVTASMATMLLAAGTKGRRYALPHATIHMHPAGGGAQGYTPDVEIQYKELQRMQQLLHQLLSKHTGQSVEKIADDFDRDRYMSAEEAVDYGIIDEVLKLPGSEAKEAKGDGK
jgi:ATP-dependent Clp protease, protease subunit